LALPTSDVRWRLHNALVALLLTVLLWRVVWPALAERNFGIEVGPQGNVTIRDMAAHLTFAKAFWRDRADYTVQSHLRIVEQWAGTEVANALPFGYSPTMLWLLGPLCPLPTVWAYVAWSLLGAAGVWWLTRRGRCVPVAGALLLLGPLGLACFALGQTAFLSAAALVALQLRSCGDQKVTKTGWSRDTVVDAALLWALSAKPPLAVVAGAALLASRQWRTVALAVVLTAATTVAVTPRLGLEWPSQYLHLVTRYDRQTADAAFAWSLCPDHMSNLRSILWSTGVVNDQWASRLSTLVWLGATVAITLLALRGKLTARAIWPLAALGYLLFCPHVTSTEDLHLAVLFAALAAFGRPWDRPAPAVMMILGLVVVFLAPGTLLQPGLLRSALLFTAKLTIAAAWLFDNTAGPRCAVDAQLNGC
jgi:hypothetical protein